MGKGGKGSICRGNKSLIIWCEYLNVSLLLDLSLLPIHGGLNRCDDAKTGLLGFVLCLATPRLTSLPTARALRSHFYYRSLLVTVQEIRNSRTINFRSHVDNAEEWSTYSHSAGYTIPYLEFLPPPTFVLSFTLKSVDLSRYVNSPCILLILYQESNS